MKNFLTIFLVLFSTYSLSGPLKLEHESILLNGIYSSIPYKSKSIALILHGTRGHQNLELINSLRDSLLANGVDSLTINLSYGIDNRANDFLSCDIEHRHKQSNSQHEIKLWYEYIKKMTVNIETRNIKTVPIVEKKKLQKKSYKPLPTFNSIQNQILEMSKTI